LASQELSNILWAFATNKVECQELERCIIESEDALEKIVQGRSSEIANICWALAASDNSLSHVLFDRVASISDILGETADVASICSIAQTFAKSQYASDDFFNMVEQERVRICKDGSPSDLARLCWAHAKSKRASPKLFRSVAAKTDKLTRHSTPSEIAILAWSFATLGHCNEKLFRGIAKTASFSLCSEGSFQNIANTLYAFTLTGFHLKEDLFMKRLWERVLFDDWESGESDEFDSDGAGVRQLHLCYVSSIVEDAFVLKGKPERLLMAAAKIYDEDEIVESCQHFEFSKLIGNYCDDGAGGGEWKTENEIAPFEDCDGFNLLAIDIVMASEGGRKVAIELNGPTHYLLGDRAGAGAGAGAGGGGRNDYGNGNGNGNGNWQCSKTLNGKSIFKKRILEVAGYEYTSVDLDEFLLAQIAGKEKEFVQAFADKVIGGECR